MRSPKPAIPAGAPAGTVWYGGPIEWFSISFRITGQDLIPDKITQLLQCKPDQAEQKGDPIYRKDGSLARHARSGGWRLVLKPGDTDEWNCGEAMMELLRRLPADVAVWRTLSERFEIDFFIGLTMTSKNKGFSLTPGVMSYLAERGIEVGFDIYYEPADASSAEK